MEQEMNLSGRMLRLMDRVHRLQRSRPAPELARKEFMTLHVLRGMCIREERGVSLNALADEMTVSPPAVSRIIQILVERGYVERKPDPYSRRSVILRLTEEGEAKDTEIDKNMQVHMQQIFSSIGDEKAEEFYQTALKLVELAEQDIAAQKKEMKESNV